MYKGIEEIDKKMKEDAKALLNPYEKEIADKLFEDGWYVHGRIQTHQEVNIISCTDVTAYLPENRKLWCSSYPEFIDKVGSKFKYLGGVNVRDVKDYTKYKDQIYRNKEIFDVVEVMYDHCRKTDLKNITLHFSGEFIPGLFELKYRDKTLKFIIAPIDENVLLTVWDKKLTKDNTYFVK